MIFLLIIAVSIGTLDYWLIEGLPSFSPTTYLQPVPSPVLFQAIDVIIVLVLVGVVLSIIRD